MKLKYLFLPSIAVLTLAACNDDKPESSEAPAAPVATEQTAEEATQAFFDNIFSGNIDQAAELIYLPEGEQDQADYIANAKSQLTEAHKHLSGDDADFVGAEAGQANISATIPVTMKGKDGDSKTNELELIKTAEGWKIDMRHAF